MANEKELMIPVVSEDQGLQYLPAGMHICKITDIEAGKPDKNGNASHEYTFEDKEKRQIKKSVYFSTDRNKPCKGEWVYAKLKAAIGMKGNDVKSKKEIVGLKLWVGISQVEVIDKEGKPVLNKNGNPTKYSEVIPDFFAPYVKGEAAPVHEGDPALNGGKASMKFHEIRIENAKVAAVSNDDDALAAPSNTTASNDDF
jgi:hypothetical protein